jgi:hypothetical protein
MNNLLSKYLKKFDNIPSYLIVIFLIYTLTTYFIWKKYEFEPTSMLHFGNEFIELNLEYMPPRAVVEKGYEGDLGAGYDGQIFYFYSRALNSFPLKWPVGFDDSYRAPRIGYPFLISIFGWMGGSFGSIFGMYFWNIALFITSVFALRKILGDYSYLTWFYVISPFSLGSYTVLVSDSVMVSLVIISYYFYLKEKYIPFILIASLAVLTKEPSLFLYFPLGLSELKSKNFKKAFVVVLILLIPILWHSYLRVTFPDWKPTRLLKFILPFEGVTTYLGTLISAGTSSDWKELARAFSRFPLFVTLLVGIYSALAGSFKRGTIYRLGLLLNYLMILFAGYYHFWSVYENVSRMFAISVPLMIMLAKEDGEIKRLLYLIMLKFTFLLFVIKIIFIQKAQDYFIWTL